MEPYQATLFRELSKAGVSYVLCGGLAIVLHGIHRFTADIDLAMKRQIQSPRPQDILDIQMIEAKLRGRGP